MAIICIAGIGLAAAVTLAVADRCLSVKEDPRIGLVTAALPGANCGGCGFPGCDGYARALVAGTAPNGACAAGGEACAAEISKILGIAATATERRVALVKCCGTRSEAIRVGDYNGICDCSVAAATAGGDKGCTYGCLGYGACANVCPVHAISIHDGLAKVDKRLCIGCGKCVKTCPKHLIEIVPYKSKYHVRCMSQDKGKAVMDACSAGCIGCTLCTKECHFDAIHMNGNVAQIDYTKCKNCSLCAKKCPKGVIN